VRSWLKGSYAAALNVRLLKQATSLKRVILGDQKRHQREHQTTQISNVNASWCSTQRRTASMRCSTQLTGKLNRWLMSCTDAPFTWCWYSLNGFETTASAPRVRFAIGCFGGTERSSRALDRERLWVSIFLALSGEGKRTNSPLRYPQPGERQLAPI
jgi:hypothetical protein